MFNITLKLHTHFYSLNYLIFTAKKVIFSFPAIFLTILLVACDPGSFVGEHSETGDKDQVVTNNDLDNDGVPNSQDAWPYDPAVTTAITNGNDLDGDGVVNVRDLDADGNGLIEIFSAEELDMIRLDYAGTSFAGDTSGCVYKTSPTAACNGYELIGDIDLSVYPSWEPIGHCIANNECPEMFTGIFDGKGYSISNLNIAISGNTFGVGLFAAIGPRSEIRNLHIEGARIKVSGGNDARDIGAMVGFGRNGARLVDTSVSGVIIDAPVATAVGGLIGDSYKAYLGNSFAIVEELIAKDGIGGLTGYGDSAVIEKSSALVQKISGENYLGGLVGDGRNIQITSSAVNVQSIQGLLFIGGLIGDGRRAKVEAVDVLVDDISGTNYVGGLIGDALEASAVKSQVTINTLEGDTAVGGLLGWASNATIIGSSIIMNSLNGADDIGGLVGNGSNMTISSSIGQLGEISGDYNVGKLVGSGEGNHIDTSRVSVGSIRSSD